MTQNLGTNRFLDTILQQIYYLLYHQFAWTYDWVSAAVSCGRWQDWIKVTLPFLTGPRVLELGHGPGHLHAALQCRQISVVGIDASAPMGRIARRVLLRKGILPILVNGYAQFLSFKSESFDQVVATFPSDYIFDPLTLSEARRVLKQNGKLIVLLGAWNTNRNLCQKLTGWLLRTSGEHALETIRRYTDPFNKAGFKAELKLLDQVESRLVLILAERY